MLRFAPRLLHAPKLKRPHVRNASEKDTTLLTAPATHQAFLSLSALRTSASSLVQSEGFL